MVEQHITLEILPEGEQFITLETSGEMPSSEWEHYTGEYDVTPLITAQTLYTNQKVMDDDVRIEMIPTHEVENPAGGVTFIIG